MKRALFSFLLWICLGGLIAGFAHSCNAENKAPIASNNEVASNNSAPVVLEAK